MRKLNRMKTMLPLRIARFAPSLLALGTCLLAFCSCALLPAPAPIEAARELPPEVAMNPGAGRGNELFLPLHFAGGEPLAFLVDTGSPVTIFDQSLEPQLGKRLGNMEMWNFGAQSQMGIYAAPRLYLGGTPLLRTGTNVETTDFRALSAKAGLPIMGVLGMDYLRHYCLQLDFNAGVVRFLDPGHLATASLGRAYPLIYNEEVQSRWGFIRPLMAQGSLIGGAGHRLLVDSGYRNDGALDGGVFHRAVRQAHESGPGDAVPAQDSGRVWFATCDWQGGTYTNLLVGTGGNLIGLRFLARHLVTLNFPKQTMYLKPTSVGPLTSPDMDSAWAWLMSLKAAGRLPGWPSTDSGALYIEGNGQSVAFDGQKAGAPFTWHYTVARELPDGRWQLQKAWRADASDHLLEEYPIP